MLVTARRFPELGVVGAGAQEIPDTKAVAANPPLPQAPELLAPPDGPPPAGLPGADVPTTPLGDEARRRALRRRGLRHLGHRAAAGQRRRPAATGDGGRPPPPCRVGHPSPVGRPPTRHRQRLVPHHRPVGRRAGWRLVGLVRTAAGDPGRPRRGGAGRAERTRGGSPLGGGRTARHGPGAGPDLRATCGARPPRRSTCCRRGAGGRRRWPDCWGRSAASWRRTTTTSTWWPRPTAAAGGRGRGGGSGTRLPPSPAATVRDGLARGPGPRHPGHRGGRGHRATWTPTARARPWSRGSEGSRPTSPPSPDRSSAATGFCGRRPPTARCSPPCGT